MTRGARTDLDARVAAAWPITVDEAAGPSTEVRAEIDRRIDMGVDPIDPVKGPAAPPSVRPRRWAVAVVAAVLVVGAIVLGGVIAQRLTGDTGVISPIDDDPVDPAGGAIEDPRRLLDAAVERTRATLDDSGLRWSTELWRTARPVDVSVVTREQLGSPHVARYREADRDGDWSQRPVPDAGAPPLLMRGVDGQVFARMDGGGEWTEITRHEGLDGPRGRTTSDGRTRGRLLDRERLMDAVAALRFVEAAPSDDGLIHLVTPERGNEGPLAVAMLTLPGGAGGQPRGLQADVAIDPASGSIREVTLWQRRTFDAELTGEELDVVFRTAVAPLVGADVPDIVAPDTRRVASLEDFCTTSDADPGRCMTAAFVRPGFDQLDDVVPVDP
ncbi:MAG TPA: hypothetical protein VFZ70_00955 [Euzebyales bacterium]